MANHLTPDELSKELGIERQEVIRVCVEEGVPIYQGKIDKTLFQAQLAAIGALRSSTSVESSACATAARGLARSRRLCGRPLSALLRRLLDRRAERVHEVDDRRLGHRLWPLDLRARSFASSSARSSRR